MRVLIAGCGRSGTSMAIEIFAGSSVLQSPIMVDRKILNTLKMRDNTVTKIGETCTWDVPQIEKLLAKYDNLKIIWSIRDPRDIIMSKMRRGVNGPGGDGKAADATPKSSVDDVKDMRRKYDVLKERHSDRIYLLKMEDVITNFEETVGKACDFLGIEYEPEMKNFYKRMRNAKKKRRYKTIDQNEVSKWKDWRTAYNGFFKNKDLDALFPSLEEEIRYFDYE